ncbi:ATP-binding cassette domain-containing protein [Micromonospora sp. NPDC005087]|uniref:ATP-binding cassette domain-containing protein n=1 Tax=Micromonospora sp. NPDC005087 TaxID=3364225 RepID=UPI0036BCE207
MRRARVRPSRRRTVLTDLHLALRRGQAVAIVGASGAGKSTLADLIAGLITPERGEIVINGDAVLRDVDIDRWRRRIAYASQFPYSFTDSLRANLYYGTWRLSWSRTRLAPLTS